MAARLADLQRTRGAFGDCPTSFAKCSRRRTPRIVPMASELADVATNHLSDPMLAISALERVRDVSPTHVPSLFLLAELFIGQRAWDKALVALEQTIKATSERGTGSSPTSGVPASIGASSISCLRRRRSYARLSSSNPTTRGRSARCSIGKSDPRAERGTLLARLVLGETRPAERCEALFELAETACEGRHGGAEGALVEAASLSPDPGHARTRSSGGRHRYADICSRPSRAVGRAHESGRPIDPSWLMGSVTSSSSSGATTRRSSGSRRRCAQTRPATTHAWPLPARSRRGGGTSSRPGARPVIVAPNRACPSTPISSASSRPRSRVRAGLPSNGSHASFVRSRVISRRASRRSSTHASRTSDMRRAPGRPRSASR